MLSSLEQLKGQVNTLREERHKVMAKAEKYQVETKRINHPQLNRFFTFIQELQSTVKITTSPKDSGSNLTNIIIRNLIVRGKKEKLIY
jgi:hypothetical protein